MTKLYYLLYQRNMSQRDLQRAILEKHGIKYADERISRMVTGRLSNYQISTAKIIASTLNVKLDDIVD